MRDYSKMTDEELKAVAFRHYTDEEEWILLQGDKRLLRNE